MLASKNWLVANILNEAHTDLKGHLNGRSTVDYIQAILHWYWPNIYLDCEEYVNKCLKCRMHKIHKKIVKFIRSKKTYERYQGDLVEISKKSYSINKSYNLLTCVDHFSKYAWGIPIKNKEAIIARNAIVQVFIQGYIEILQPYNGREFVNKNLDAYLIRTNVRHILGSPNHPQS